MPYETPPKTRLLLVSGSPGVIKVFRRAITTWADLDVAATVLDCHREIHRSPYYDAVAVDQTLDWADPSTTGARGDTAESMKDGQLSASAGLVAWLHATRRMLGTVLLRSSGRRVEAATSPDVDAVGFALDVSTDLDQRLKGFLSERLKCVVQVVVPMSPEWTRAAMSARENIASNCEFLRLEVLREPSDTTQLRDAAVRSDVDFETAADKHLQSSQVASLVVITGDAENDVIAMAGGNRNAGCMRNSAKRVLDNTAGYDRTALLLYLIVRSALVTGAGLERHRSVAGCPADYCFDLLDLARGMTKGEICDSCREILGRRLLDGSSALTPIQIADLESVLVKVRKHCGVAKEAGNPGGVLPPEAVNALPLVVCQRGCQSPNMTAATASDLPRVASVVKEHFNEYSQAERILSDDCSFLLAARHYNSDSPTIPGARGFARRSNIDAPVSYQGGGYFLAHAGIGVAIDPGYDFLRILYGLTPYWAPGSKPHSSRGYTTEDIDLVIVTHNHLDHLADLETILRSRRGRPLWVYCNPEVRDEYHLERRRYNTRLELIDWEAWPSEAVKLPSPMSQHFTMQRLPALHWQHTYSLPLDGEPEERLRRHLRGFGVRVQLRRPPGSGAGVLDRLVITSDTLCPVLTADGDHGTIDKGSFEPYISPKHWSRLMMRHSDWTDPNCRKLAEAYELFVERYSRIKADLACVHIGSLEKEGWSTGPGGNLAALRYDGHHLGLMGCYRLLRMMEEPPRLVLMSEFGEELVGFRTHMCSALRGMLDNPRGSAPNVLPTDIGLCIDLRNGHVRCTRCDGTHDFSDVRAVERGNDFLDYVPSEVAQDSRSTCHWRSVE